MRSQAGLYGCRRRKVPCAYRCASARRPKLASLPQSANESFRAMTAGLPPPKRERLVISTAGGGYQEKAKLEQTYREGIPFR
jgi:hypothetical protein